MFVFQANLEVGTSPIYGIVTLLPVVASFLFLFPHWWRTEKTIKRRCLTLPFLLLQIWPQFRVIELLVILWKQSYDTYVVKKEHYYRDLSSLGKYLSLFYLEFSFEDFLGFLSFIQAVHSSFVIIGP